MYCRSDLFRTIKRGGALMKKPLKILISLILIIGIGTGVYFIFFAKSDELKMVERLEEFEDAYAKGDLSACIDCLDSKSRNALKAFGSLGSELFDIGDDSLSSLFSIGVAAQDERLKFTVKTIKYTDDTHAELTVDLWTSGDYLYKEQTNEVELEMVKEGNDWYIVEDSKWF